MPSTARRSFAPSSPKSRGLAILLALVLATAASAILAGGFDQPATLEQRILSGLILIAAAATLFGWAAPRPLAHEPEVGASPVAWFGERRWAFGAAVGVYVLSLLLWLAAGENALIRLLWVVGMALFVFAHLGQWQKPPWSRADGWDLLLVAGITAAGFVLRFWRLTELPSYLHGDIASQGLQALEILRDPSPTWFGAGWSNIPFFDFVMMGWSMRLFGQDLFGLSMTAVLQGTLTIPALYLLGRELFGRRAGAIAAALLAISYTHIQFSRIITTASPLLIICLTFFALFRGMRLRSGLWYSLAGIFLGLGLLVYYPIRVSVIMVILLAVWLLIWKRQSVRANLGGWFSFAAGSLVGFGPMMAYALTHFSEFIGRGNEVTLANPTVMQHLMGKYAAVTPVQVWVEQFQRTFLTFFLYGDSSTHFAFPGPMVGALTAVLLILGLGYTLRWLRDERFFALLVWFLSTMLLGGVITNDPPFWPHIVIVVPAVALMAAAAAERGWSGLTLAFGEEAGRQHRVDQAVGLLLALAILVSGWQGWQAYVNYTGDNADSRVRAARYIAALPSDTLVVVVRDPIAWAERELMFMGQGHEGIDVTPDQIQAGGLAASDRPTVFILTPNHADMLSHLQEQYPGGEAAEHVAAAGWSAFSTFTTTPAGYVRPDGLVDPTRSLATRTQVVWLLAFLVFGLAAAAGLFLVRRSPRPTASASLPATTLRPAQAPIAAKAIVPAGGANAPPPANDAVPVSMLQESRLSGRQLALSVGGMVAALILAYFAQLFYDASFRGPLLASLLGSFPSLTSPQGQLLAGTIGYVLAMILFAVAAPALPKLVAAVQTVLAPAQPGPRRPYPGELPPDARIIRPTKPGTPTRAPATAATTSQPATPIDTRLQLILLAVAFVPYALAMFRFARQGEDALVRWLWLAALGVFLAGQVIWPLLRRIRGNGAELSPPFRWPQVAILAAILLAGFWLRFNQLETIPNDLHGDMASMGLQARDWLASSDRSLFHEGWANIPILGFLPAALGLRFFGNDLFGLNLSAVLAGMLSLIGLYLLVWRMFDSHRLAALATAVLVVNIPHIHFSRLAAYMDPWPFALFGAFFLVDGLRARRPQSLALAGLLLGFGLQMYYSGRVIVIILAFAFLYLLLARRQWLRANWLGLGLVIAALFLTIGPNLIYYYRFPEPFLERSRAVWLFFEPVMTHLKGKYGLQTPMQVLWEQTKLSLLMFNRSIDSSTQFGFPHPMFFSLLSPLVVLGFGYSLRRWRHPGVGLNLIWLLVMIINGSILTGDAPFWPRLVGVLPAAAVLAALTLDRLWAALSQVAPERQQRGVNILLGAAVVALLAFAGWRGWNQYYDAVKDNARSQAFLGRFLYDLPTDIAACSFNDPMALQVRETYFLAWPRQIVDLPADAPDGLIERCPGPPFVWILTPNHLARLTVLQQRWPGGQVQDHFYGTGAPAFTSYLVEEGVRATEAEPFATPAPGEPPQVPPDQPQPSGPAAPAGPTFPAYLPDGTAFAPDETFLGNTDSALWEVVAGQKEVTGGSFRLEVGPLSGHDAAYDYVELRGADGSVYRFEAEDGSVTSGDEYGAHEGVDGHWWLQNFGSFSGGQGLIAHKQESVPVLITAGSLPDGLYDVIIGSFTGDPANGVFALGIRWEP